MCCDNIYRCTHVARQSRRTDIYTFLPSDGENMVLMLDLKSLGQQSAVLPDLAEKNKLLTIVFGHLTICHRHVEFVSPSAAK